MACCSAGDQNNFLGSDRAIGSCCYVVSGREQTASSGRGQTAFSARGQKNFLRSSFAVTTRTSENSLGSVFRTCDTNGNRPPQWQMQHQKFDILLHTSERQQHAPTLTDAATFPVLKYIMHWQLMSSHDPPED